MDRFLLDSGLGLIQIKDEVKMLHYDDIAPEALRGQSTHYMQATITCWRAEKHTPLKRRHPATASAAAKLMCIDGTRVDGVEIMPPNIFFLLASLHHLKYFLSSKTMYYLIANSGAFIKWYSDCWWIEGMTALFVGHRRTLCNRKVVRSRARARTHILRKFSVFIVRMSRKRYR